MANKMENTVQYIQDRIKEVDNMEVEKDTINKVLYLEAEFNEIMEKENK